MSTVQLRHGDCVEFIRGLDDNSVDLALYDPPYFMGYKPLVHKGKNYVRLVEAWDNQWESVDQYLEWCRAWLTETWRVLKPGGTILVFGSHHTIFHVHVLMATLQITGQSGSAFTFRNFLVWHVTNAPPFVLAKAHGLYVQSSQYINVFTKGKRAAYFDYEFLKELNGGKQHRDWFLLPQERNRERVGHPSQKPRSFIQTLVQAHAPREGLVVDCFLGSGTTGLACASTNRNFIGSDISEEYVRMAYDRLRGTLRREGYVVKESEGEGGGDSRAFQLLVGQSSEGSV